MQAGYLALEAIKTLSVCSCALCTYMNKSWPVR